MEESLWQSVCSPLVCIVPQKILNQYVIILIFIFSVCFFHMLHERAILIFKNGGMYG